MPRRLSSHLNCTIPLKSFKHPNCKNGRVISESRNPPFLHQLLALGSLGKHLLAEGVLRCLETTCTGWGCPPSKFPWTYSAKETCYLLKGKVRVYPDGSNQAVEIGAGDLVEFPKGMSCTWDVSEEVDKHYKFE
ncbi:putative endoplasmic oxidoreductin-1-like [Capsicum annuum]|nr:putative endoplasmic oxidoreductin-1-like [Capsicum annuum]